MHEKDFFININESSLSRMRELSDHTNGIVTFNQSKGKVLSCKVESVGMTGIAVEVANGNITAYTMNDGSIATVTPDGARKQLVATLHNAGLLLVITINKIATNVFYVKVCKYPPTLAY